MPSNASQNEWTNDLMEVNQQIGDSPARNQRDVRSDMNSTLV